MLFQAARRKMNSGDELDLEEYISRSEKISCADVRCKCYLCRGGNDGCNGMVHPSGGVFEL